MDSLTIGHRHATDTITGSRTAAWVAFAIASAINFAVANAAGGRTNGVFLLGLVALACGWVPLAHGKGGAVATVAFLGALVAAYPLLADGSWWAPVVVWLTLIVLCFVAALAGDSVRILRRRR